MDASQPDIKKAYRKAALKLHPDVNEAADATAKFAQLSSAYGMSYLLAGFHAGSIYAHAYGKQRFAERTNCHDRMLC